MLELLIPAEQETETTMAGPSSTEPPASQQGLVPHF